MPVANPLNSPGTRSQCRCGSVTLVDFPPAFETTYRCRHCGTSPTLHRWDGSVYQGEKHWLWKGENAGYSGKHSFNLRHFVKTGQCETCGETGRTDWANVDHQYRRVRADWVELCRPCHSARDRSLVSQTSAA